MIELFLLYSLTISAILFTWRVLTSQNNPAQSLASTKQDELNRLIKNAPELLKLSGSAIAKKIKSREVTCEHVVRTFIKHLEEVNPYLNAICAKRYETAILEAREIDEQLPKTPPHIVEKVPFLGVPFIAKECFEVPDLPYTAGIICRKGILGKRYCPAIRRMVEKGGAIVVASGNISEGCMWYESDNVLYGRSNNPYDLTRTPGGSSGGNAALVAALGAPFAVTSDVAGSTRIPSLYNGVFGHKPTGGTIPNWRTIPVVKGEVERYCQLGPCCRKAEDLFPILGILAGEVSEEDEPLNKEIEFQNSFMRSFLCPPPSTVDIAHVRVLVLWDQPGSYWPFVSRRSKDMVDAQEKALQALKKLGCVVEVVKFRQLQVAFDIWFTMLAEAETEAEEIDFYSTISDGNHKFLAFCELFIWLISFGKASNHTLPALGFADILARSFTPRGFTSFIAELGSTLRHEMEEKLAGNTILLMPSLPVEAPRHGPVPNVFRFADVAATSILNVMEFPATAVPMGLGSKGLPTGVQIVAAHGNDHLTIAAAIALEKLGVAGWETPWVFH